MQLQSPPSDIAPITLNSFKSFSSFITKELGIKMPESKMSMLQSRLRRRIRALDLDSIEQYRDHLFDPDNRESELVHFFDAVTTNKTDFFREPQHFSYLVNEALPTLAPRPGSRMDLKLWCAGCSTGEEPYTLAMTLADYCQDRDRCDFTILASDISSRVLQTARTAIYEESKIQPVPHELRKRYLLRSREPGSSLIRIAAKLREHVRFRRINFMDADYGVHETYDIIFFRNVMIYFDRPTQEQVVNKLSRNLRPGGYLFVGHSESLAGLDIPFQQAGSAIYRKVK